MSDAPTLPRRGLAAFEPLMPAEARILAELQSGQFDRLGDGLRPAEDEADPERIARAEFLRFLLLGGEEGCRPHEKGLRVTGARIIGALDLEGCRIPRDIGLVDCAFEAPVNLRSAVIDNLFLDGSSLPGMRAERVEARGGLSLNGADVAGAIRLVDARLGAALSLDGLTLSRPGETALLADGIEVRGAVFMRGAHVTGAVSLARARIGADLDCVGLSLGRPGVTALTGDGMTVGGDIALRNVVVDGALMLRGVTVGGDVDCTGASFAAPGAVALELNRSKVAGVFFLRRAVAVRGAVDLRETDIGAIEDDRTSWPGAGELLLNRCRYGAFIGGPVDAPSRLDWLALQNPGRWGEDFWPQPFEQLASVFRAMGHDEDARRVLIAKERLQRRARRERTRSPLKRAALALLDGTLAVTLRYGRQPLLAVAWLALFWAVGVGVFAAAERQGAFKPSLPFILRTPEWLACSVAVGEALEVPSLERTLAGKRRPGESQLDCFRAQPEAASYPRFHVFMYAADVLLPVLMLGQTNYWRPDPSRPLGGLALDVYYFLALVGWALSLLAVAGFSGLVKSG